jgi:dipeptidyl aminopeptidase/acylaminoacyl peptidase
MNNELLEARLRRWYRASADAEPLAPAALRTLVMDVPIQVAGTGRRAARNWTLLAAAALMGVIVAAAAFVASSNILRVSKTATPLPTISLVPPTPSPTATPTAQPTAQATSTASPILIPGNLIAVYHLLGDTAELVTIDPLTGEQERVGTMPVALQPLGKNVFAATLGPGFVAAAWSTDRRLVTISRVGDGSFVTAQFDVVAQSHREISLKGESYVSPDGRLAATFDDFGGIAVEDLDGNVLKQLDGPADGRFYSQINWAPDGSALLVGGFVPAEPSAGNVSGQNVFAATVGGPGWLWIVPRNDAPIVGFGGDPALGIDVGPMSPDLSWLVAPTYCNSGAPASCTPGLIEINVESADRLQLTDQSSDSEPHWSPDGTRIAFGRMSGSGRGVWVMNADGSNLTRLTTPARPLLDHDIAWAPDGSAIAFTRGRITDAGRLGDVYVLPAAGGEPRLLMSDAIADW